MERVTPISSSLFPNPPNNVTANNSLAVNQSAADFATKNYDTMYLADDQSLDHIPEFITANYIDYIYAPICSAMGILGNILAFCVLVGPRSSVGTTYVYMASLSVSDTLVQIVNILFLVRKFPGHETLKEGTCGFVFFLLYFSIHYNVVVMVTMTIERYIVIRFPLQASRWFTVKRARVIVLVEALLVFGLDMQHLILRGMAYDENTGKYFCMPMGKFTTFYLFKVWPWVDGVIYCYAPLACLVVFNCLIVRQVRSSRSFQSQNDTMSKVTASNKSKMADKESQLTRMLLLVTTAFLIFVCPMAVIIVVERNYWFPKTPVEKAQYHLVRTILNNLDYTNHALNFLLYCFSGSRFRQELRQTFGCFSSSRGVGRKSDSGPGCDSISESAYQDRSLNTSVTMDSAAI